jgi:hypothetical protein
MHNTDIKKLLLEYCAGLLLSVGGFLIFVGVYNLLAAVKINIGFGGDKAKVFTGLFLGLPLGSVLGILLVDRFVYRIEITNYLNPVIGLILGFLGVYCGVIMLDKVGGLSVLLIPIVVTGLCLLGINKLFIF